MAEGGRVGVRFIFSLGYIRQTFALNFCGRRNLVCGSVVHVFAVQSRIDLGHILNLVPEADVKMII